VQLLAGIKQLNLNARICWYFSLALTLLSLLWFCGDISWQGSSYLHSSLEIVTAAVAFIVAMLALVRYYAFKELLHLYIGIAFLGTGVLDAHHAVVTADFIQQTSNTLPSNWLSSNLFLSFMLVISLLADYCERNNVKLNKLSLIPADLIYIILFVSLPLVFLLLLISTGNDADLSFNKLEELIASLLFVIALAGYTVKEKWHDDIFEHWLMVALIINVIAQVAVIPYSTELFDFQYDAAHFLVKLSYLSVLIGLIVSMFYIFRDENKHKEELLLMNQSLVEKTVAVLISEERTAAIVRNAVDGIFTIDEMGIVLSVNPAAIKLFGYQEDEILGQNIKLLMPTGHREQHDQYLKNYKETRNKKIIGIGREVEGQHKNGRRFPIDLAVSEVKLNAGERFFTGVVRDISEKKQAEKMKNEFLSTVSHELRTPLTSIHCSLGLITDTFADVLPEKIRKLHAIAYKNSERLIHLINDILDVQKMEEMSFSNETINLIAVVEKSVIANQAYAKKLANVSLQVLASTDSINVYADEGRLTQVLSNLISNAVKFSPENSVVKISVTEANNKVRVDVIDSGPGIPEEFKSRVFTKFAQADSSDTRKVEGTGLGLSISKIIIEKLTGSIGFVNLENEGCNFYFILPIKQTLSKSHEISESVSQLANGSNVHILICEDDQDIASFLQIMFEVEGWKSDVALNAKQARSLLQKNEYSVMTLDIVLPDYDGLAFFKELRASERYAGLPIIMVSGLAQEKQVELGGITSVTDWIDKPIDREKLQSAIKQAVMQSAGPSDCNILHVEDDADIASLVKTLVDGQADIYHANNVSEAEQLFMQRHYSLVLLDLMLPDGNGLDLLPLISHKLKQYTNPPAIIIFSAYEMDEKIPEEIKNVLIKSRCSNEQLLDVIKANIQQKSDT